MRGKLSGRRKEEEDEEKGEGSGAETMGSDTIRDVKTDDDDYDGDDDDFCESGRRRR